MRPKAFLLFFIVVLLASGCETEPSAYKAAPTAECLRDKDVRVITERSQLGVVERSTENGGLIVYTVGNAVRIAFGANEEDTLGIEEGYRRFVSKRVRPHIGDVMRTEKNAVLLWTVTPSDEAAELVTGCLKG
jgi:hypothetical protein